MNPDDRLIEASQNGDIVKVKSLLKEGANVNFKNNSSLFVSSFYSGTTSSDDMVRLLISEGANVNAKSQNGQTVLMVASSYSNSTSSLSTVKLLLDKGADINAKDNNGMTSLMFSTSYSNSTSSLTTIELLLDKGANIEAKDIDGFTSLTYASSYSNSTSSLDTVRLLLSYGADPFIKSNKGKYPLDHCKTISCKKIISTSMWNIMNNTIKKSAGIYSEETPINKDIWELILLRNKQRQLCKDLGSEENKYVLQGFATMLNIPITVLMTKSQLCNLVSKQLSWGGKYSEESVKYLQRKDKLADVIKLAKFLNIDTNQSFYKILDDISTTVGLLTSN